MLPGMNMSCPSCSAPMRPRPVLDMRCRKCGHRWRRVLQGGIAFELQRTEGDEPIGPLERGRIREMLYAGALTGRERVRLPGSDGGWTPLTERDEFAEILTLLDIQAPRSRRIQGWQSQGTRPEEKKKAPPPPPAPVAPRPPVEPEKPASRAVLVIVGVVVVLVAAALALTL